jgi:hypothetical protein
MPTSVYYYVRLMLENLSYVKLAPTQWVLPGPEKGSSPIEQKFTPLWQKHDANSNFFKVRYFSVIFSLFPELMT